MKNLGTIGRYLFAIPFLIFGLMHFAFGGNMAGMVPSFIPGGVFWVYLTGAALVAAAVSFFIQKKVRLAGSLLALMLLIFVLTMHAPGTMAEDQMASQMSMTMMLKDLALAGGALLLASRYEE